MGSENETLDENCYNFWSLCLKYTRHANIATENQNQIVDGQISFKIIPWNFSGFSLHRSEVKKKLSITCTFYEEFP